MFLYSRSIAWLVRGSAAHLTPCLWDAPPVIVVTVATAVATVASVAHGHRHGRPGVVVVGRLSGGLTGKRAAGREQCSVLVMENHKPFVVVVLMV